MARFEEIVPDNKTKIIGVKVTEKEFERVKNYCADNCFSVSDYVRYLIKKDLDSNE